MPTTSKGAIAPPAADPLSNSATAQPRSDLGNHSETTFVAPGQLAASPQPRRKRKNDKLFNPPAREVAMAASEYHETEYSSPRRVPTKSRNLPMIVCPTAYAMRKAMMSRAKSEFDQ